MEVLTKAARDRRSSDRAFAATQDERHDDLLDELDGHYLVPLTPHLCAAPHRCAALLTASHHCISPPLSPRRVVLDPPCRNSAPRHDRRR
jgi:hypothetical protein